MDGPTVGEVLEDPLRGIRLTRKRARVLRPGPELAILIYEAKARRQDEEASHSAIVSSVYARHAGGWRLPFHQQRPSQSSL